MINLSQQKVDQINNNISTMQADQQKQEHLNGGMIVVGLTNGMIGSLVLILPLLSLQAGYIFTFIVILVTSVISFVSCYLCLLHLGNQKDLDSAILRHFNGSKFMKIFYDLCVWSNLFLINVLYFDLIVDQWEGLVPPYGPTLTNPLVNFALLLGLVILLKYIQLGASVMAYGIASIIIYLLFLIWVVVTDDSSYDNTYSAFGSGAVSMAASMGQAFSIQAFFIPVLRKNLNQKKYPLYTLITYICATSAYVYIAYMGAFGILHRQSQESNPQTIEDYFQSGDWQIKIIEAVYLVHLYSVFPQFLLVTKKRIFSIFGLEETVKGKISVSQIIYFVVFTGICLTLNLVGVQIDNIIALNGSVVGFLFIYLLPALLHIKCMYFCKGKLPLPSNPDDRHPQESIVVVSSLPKQTVEIESSLKKIDQPLLDNRQSISSTTSHILQLQQKDLEYRHYYCDVSRQNYTRCQEGVSMVLIGLMLLLGLFIMVNGIIDVS